MYKEKIVKYTIYTCWKERAVLRKQMNILDQYTNTEIR